MLVLGYSYFVGRSFLLRIIIYLFPVLINIVLGGVTFISAFRFSEAGASAVMITGTMAVWAIVYSLSSLLVGRLVTEKNAAKIIVRAGCFLALVSLAFVGLPNLHLQYLWIALTGVGGAFYCTPFQVFMKSFEGKGASSGIVYSTAMYTAAWSAGMACGPLIFAVFAWQTAFYINVFFSLCLAFGVFIIEKMRTKVPLPAARFEAKSEIDYGEYPDLAYLGWLCTGVGTATIAIVRTLEPKLAVDLGLTKMHAGCILALVSIMQVTWGLAWIKSKRWMFKSSAAFAAGLCGLTGLLLFAFGKKLPLLYLAAFLYGTYSSFFYFTLVFYSLVHPVNSSRYLAINEAVVGLAGITGSIGGGILAYFSNLQTTFTVAALLVGISSLHRIYALRQAMSRQKIIGK
jgi:MFS family permease